MHPSIAKHRDEIITLCKKYGVLKLEIFGSAARELDFDENNSDVDFIARFASVHSAGAFTDFFSFSNSLEQVIGRHVDLIEDMPIRNTRLRHSIDESRELVYAA